MHNQDHVVQPASNTCNPTPQSTAQSHHWRASTPRLAGIMAQAKQQAEQRYNHLQVQKQLRKKADGRKRRRPMTKRELSSLKSAEVCREKFTIYPSLLEQAIASEEQMYMDTLGKLLDMTAANVELERRIEEAQRRKDKVCKVEEKPIEENDSVESDTSSLFTLGEMHDVFDSGYDDSGYDETETVADEEDLLTPVDSDMQGTQLEELLPKKDAKSATIMCRDDTMATSELSNMWMSLL